MQDAIPYERFDSKTTENDDILRINKKLRIHSIISSSIFAIPKLLLTTSTLIGAIVYLILYLSGKFQDTSFSETNLLIATTILSLFQLGYDAVEFAILVLNPSDMRSNINLMDYPLIYFPFSFFNMIFKFCTFALPFVTFLAVLTPFWIAFIWGALAFPLLCYKKYKTVVYDEYSKTSVRPYHLVSVQTFAIFIEVVTFYECKLTDKGAIHIRYYSTKITVLISELEERGPGNFRSVSKIEESSDSGTGEYHPLWLFKWYELIILFIGFLFLIGIVIVISI